MRRWFTMLLLVLAGAAGAWWMLRPASVLRRLPLQPGEALDSLHGVVVHHNGGMNATHGRHVVDGYNVGLRYQCVEYVKRYYLLRFKHRMPDSYGHARDFFEPALADGMLNKRRGLRQHTNPSRTKPEGGDLLVLDAWTGNPYGHVAIISKVEGGELEVIQQNTGSTRATYDLDLIDGRWRVGGKRVLGWLRMP